MSNEPCEKEWEEFREAIKEWDIAAGRVQSFVSTEPLDPYKNKEPIEWNNFRDALNGEEKAHKRFIAADKALYECQKLCNLI